MVVDCARCKDKTCCTEGQDCFDMRERVRGTYTDEELRSMRVSGRIEAEHYMELTRLEELILYAREMGCERLGIAFCIGLRKEATLVARILDEAGFQVHSACCKICGLSKDEFGVTRMREEGIDTVCNPVGQAMRLNECGTQLNIVLGLCIGHDVLFTGRSGAPVTTLIVKDRVLAHNPAGAIYSKYYLEKRFNISDE
jgi:uncharacterized metal-binding protein